MSKKMQVAEIIVDDLLNECLIDFPSELYEYQRQMAINAVAHRLDDYILIEGRLIE